jgi:hypothetical protein
MDGLTLRTPTNTYKMRDGVNSFGIHDWSLLSTIIRLTDWQTTDVRYQKPHHNNKSKILSTWERAAHQPCWRVSVYVLQLHIQDTWWWMDWLCVLQPTHTRCVMEWTLLEYMTEVCQNTWQKVKDSLKGDYYNRVLFIYTQQMNSCFFKQESMKLKSLGKRQTWPFPWRLMTWKHLNQYCTTRENDRLLT